MLKCSRLAFPTLCSRVRNHASPTASLSSSTAPRDMQSTKADDIYLPLYSLQESESEKRIAQLSLQCDSSETQSLNLPASLFHISDLHRWQTIPASFKLSSIPPTVRLLRPGETTGMLAVSSEVFRQPIRRDIVHLCLVHFLDGQRQGSANTKTRWEVRGSKRKLRAQKGSGRARVGDAASPTRRGGGVSFGPKPRDFSTKLPRKLRKMGMRIAWSDRVKTAGLLAVDSLDWQSGKTKSIAERLTQLGWLSSRLLFVTGAPVVPNGLVRACNNLKAIKIKAAPEVTIHDILQHSRIVMDIQGFQFFEASLSKFSTMPEVDSRKQHVYPTKTSRRELKRRFAESKARHLANSVVQMQYMRRFGIPAENHSYLPPVPRSLIAQSATQYATPSTA